MAPIPRTQYGVKLTGKGGVEVLDYRQDLPIPDLKEGEVLIKTEYSGVNYIDT
jgi:NADPH2:quinone reductase